MPALEVSNVGIRFGGLQALEDVTFSVSENEIVGLIGPNGAGKTTLFNCVTGFYTPDEGKVELYGEDITGLSPDARTQRGLGRTFQNVGLVKSFTVRQNLRVAQHRHVPYGPASGVLGLPASLRGERLVDAKANAILDYFGLQDIADEHLSNLSYGTLKQVEVAAVVATDPAVLMLDEPLAGLGPDEAEEFGQRLLAMREDLKLTIVVIEHSVPFVLAVSDFIYVLNFGRVLARGTSDEIRDDQSVAEAYLGHRATALA